MSTVQEAMYKELQEILMQAHKLTINGFMYNLIWVDTDRKEVHLTDYMDNERRCVTYDELLDKMQDPERPTKFYKLVEIDITR